VELRGRARLGALGLLGAAFAATLLLHPWSDERVNDLFVYRTWAGSCLGGALPYRDVPFEYPPLAAPLIALPGLAGTGAEAYRIAFAALALVLAAAVVLLVGRLAARTGGSERRALVAAALAPLLTGAMIRTHFDLAPVALLLGGLLALVRRRPVLGFALLGAGAMTKGFPLVAAPVALAWLAGRGERRAALRGAAALAAVVVTVGLAALLVSPGGTVDSIRYQVDRPLQVESTPATLLLATGSPTAVKSNRSDGLVHPAADALSIAFGLALAATVAGLAALAHRRRSERDLVLLALAAVVAFAALGRVLSPQFLVWLVPLAALAAAWRRWALAAASAGAIVLTLVEFPSRYFDLVAQEPFPIAVVAARNALLVAVVVMSARAAAPARSTAPARRRPPLSRRRSTTDPRPRSRTSPASASGSAGAPGRA